MTRYCRMVTNRFDSIRSIAEIFSAFIAYLMVFVVGFYFGILIASHCDHRFCQLVKKLISFCLCSSKCVFFLVGYLFAGCDIFFCSIHCRCALSNCILSCFICRCLGIEIRFCFIQLLYGIVICFGSLFQSIFVDGFLVLILFQKCIPFCHFILCCIVSRQFRIVISLGFIQICLGFSKFVNVGLQESAELSYCVAVTLVFIVYRAKHLTLTRTV